MPEPALNCQRLFPGWLRWGSIALGAIAIVAVSFFVRHLLADPKVVLLRSRDGADWIRVNYRFDSSARFAPQSSAMYETNVDIPPNFPGADLQVAALRRVVVSLDGSAIFDTGPDLQKWKTTYLVSLPKYLKDGPHRLLFSVSNRGGPSLLRVNCPELNLRSGSGWLSSADPFHWSTAIPVDRPWYAPLPPEFESTVRDMARKSPLLICLFLIGFAALIRRPTTVDWGVRIRWLLLFAWCGLAINNIMKVPLEFGYDADQHTLYIQYVADHLSLPSPDAGWQFFQAPLYYILSAVLDRLLLLLGIAKGTVPYLLRLIPLACGGLMIEICFRAARMVFPNRFDLQAIATTIGGLLPMNIYMSQSLSNESMAAVTSGLIVLVSLYFLTKPHAIESTRALLVAGVVVGLAMLTKVSAILWLLPMGFAMAAAFNKNRSTFGHVVRGFFIVAATALLISGWMLIRNILLIGKPFYLESSLARSQWWQDPGYRTPRMFYEFGHVLTRPIYNGLQSVWDSLYGTMWGNGIVSGQPDWNFSLMSCGLWLALMPMLAILTGIWQAIAKRNPSLLFATLAIGCFTVAILYVYLTLPIYSCAKASYMLGTAPCIGLLAAEGFDVVVPWRWLRAIAAGVIFCWAVVAYLTYFVT